MKDFFKVSGYESKERLFIMFMCFFLVNNICWCVIGGVNGELYLFNVEDFLEKFKGGRAG